MKKLFKYFMVVLVAGSLFNSCDTTDLNLRENPNILGTADPALILNSVQLQYTGVMQNMNNRGSILTRISFMGGRDYFNNFQGATMNFAWSQVYSGIFPNLSALEDINANSDINYDFHVGVTKVMQAHSLLLLVDQLGTAVFSEANDPVAFPAPMLDDGASVYAAALSILDEAETLLAADPPLIGATDLFYGGDTDNWIKAINSIRLKAYVTTNNVAAFNAVIAGDNFISDTADDLQFNYGTNVLQPDTRHPDYAADYTVSGANIYQSNWLMEKMLDNNDPRIRYYFYRQVGATPGADAPPDEETLVCSLVTPPQHFIDGGFTYCSVPQGYWGRTHGNDEGTPPDGFQRAASGVYPAGGKLDGNLFANGSVVLQDDGSYDFEYDITDDGVGLGLGAEGAGIEPIILASYIDFWRADMATSDADKSSFLRAGMEKSIAKVTSFGDPSFSAGALLDESTFDTSTGEITNAVLAGSKLPTDADITAYVDGVITDYDNANGDGKENIYAEQYWIALYGGAAESYNYYRKTGFPTTLTPNWELNPGPFPRSFLLPQNEVTTNPNLTQRTDLTNQVFWDTNPSSPAFPPAN